MEAVVVGRERIENGSEVGRRPRRPDWRGSVGVVHRGGPVAVAVAAGIDCVRRPPAGRSVGEPRVARCVERRPCPERRAVDEDDRLIGRSVGVAAVDRDGRPIIRLDIVTLCHGGHSRRGELNH